LTGKGKVYTIVGEELIFDNDEGEYWEYEYDLLNRLTRVSKSETGTDNVQVVAEYVYDHNGFRVKKVRYAETGAETIYYVFGLSGEVLYKEEGEKDKYEEFVYAAGKYFAKWEGKLSEAGVVKYFYHTDHLGSVTAVTDENGNLVWSEEYLAFGEGTGVTGLIESPQIFTGKEYDVDVNFYYFNARWYDSGIGRFITEDPVRCQNSIQPNPVWIKL
jgi:RHS repeat-associated protein